jgi:hypothetical protein
MYILKETAILSSKRLHYFGFLSAVNKSSYYSTSSPAIDIVRFWILAILIDI